MSNWFSNPMPNEVSRDSIFAREEEFHHWNMYPIDLVENGYEGVIDKLKSYKATDYEKLDEEGKRRMEDEVLAIYREVDVFPIQYFSEVGVMNEIAKCIEYPAKFDGDVVSCGAGVGTVVCNYLFPNLFDVPSQHDLTKDKEGAETAYLKFKSDEFLRRSIRFCFSYKNGCPVPTNVMGGLRLVGSTPTNFRPMNAKAIYERFAPKGGVIYDFCCVSGDTEFFNGVEWKRIDEYKEGDLVLQYNEDGSAELVKPIEYIKYDSNAPFYEFISDDLPTCLTGNHDVVYRGIEGNLHKKKFEEFADSEDFYTSTIPTSFCIEDNEHSIHLDNSEVSKIVGAVLANVDSIQSEYLRVSEGTVLFSEKIFNLCKENRLHILDIFGIYDKNEVGSTLTYKIRSEELLSMIRQLCSITYKNRVEFGIEEDEYGSYYFYDGVFEIAYAYDEADAEKEKQNIKVIEGTSTKYCFVVPSHMLALRRKGVIFVTGNCGFGGRLLGALSSKNDYKYVGTDPNTETMYNLHRLGEYIEMVTGREDSYELHCCGSEDFRGPANSVDFAFSSPPYFDLEVYSDEPTQCFNKFPVLEDWLEGYVRGTIKNIYHMLKPGCTYAVNIADFKVRGGQEVAYVDEWIRISTEEGMPLYDTVYLGVTARAGTKLQAAGELKKENILVFKKPL